MKIADMTPRRSPDSLMVSHKERLRGSSGSTRQSAEKESSSGRHSETGAILILALVYIIVVSVIVAALASWATNDLNNTSKFNSVRSLQYALGSVTDTAIQSIRYYPMVAAGQTLNASPPTFCWALTGSNVADQLNIDNETVRVWCSTTEDFASSQTRVVTFSACLSTITATTCAADPQLQAVVAFDDYPPGQSPTLSTTCTSTCGEGMQLDNWTFSQVVPTLASASPTSGPIAGGTTLTLTGTGFVAGETTVNFVQESGGVPSSLNVVVPASSTNTTVTSSTSLTVVTPAVSTATTYFVTVTTQNGTSAYGPIFTY
jgi:hypothetical protein